MSVLSRTRSSTTPALRQTAIALYAWALVGLALAAHAAAGAFAWQAAVWSSSRFDSQVVGAAVLPAAVYFGIAIVRHGLGAIRLVPCEFRAGESCLERSCWGAGIEALGSCPVFGTLRWMTSLAAFSWHALDAAGATLGECALGGTIVLFFAAGVYTCAEIGRQCATNSGSHALGCLAFGVAGLCFYALSRFLVQALAVCMPRAERHIGQAG